MEKQAIFDYLQNSVRLVAHTNDSYHYETKSSTITIELWATNPETDKDECIATEYIYL